MKLVFISVKINNTSPIDVEYNEFSNRQNATLYVPIGGKSAYETAYHWKDFKEIVEIDNSHIMHKKSSKNAISIRGGATTVLFKVCAK